MTETPQPKYQVISRSQERNIALIATSDGPVADCAESYADIICAALNAAEEQRHATEPRPCVCSEKDGPCDWRVAHGLATEKEQP